MTVFGLLSTLFLLPVVLSAASGNELIVYWGQDSSGGKQQPLSYYCALESVDTILLSFLTDFPSSTRLSIFAQGCTNVTNDGDWYVDCTEMSDQISQCQTQGKKILLSLGGQFGSYGFSSESDGAAFASTLYDMFVAPSTSSDARERPFGSAVLDGFDFDIENAQSTGYVSLAKGLRAQNNTGLILAAAPQCVYPDASLGPLIDSVELDIINIQFYNNPCAIGSGFNWKTWTDAKYPGKTPKLFLGVPGAKSAASSGYVSLETLQSTVRKIGGSKEFAGIALWDASQAYSNTENGVVYGAGAKSVLLNKSMKGAAANTLTEKLTAVLALWIVGVLFACA